MSVEKIAELKVQLMGIAKEYCPASFEEMMKCFKELCKEVRI